MANVQGAVTARLLANAGVTALVPLASIYAGTVVEESRLPHLLVTSKEKPPLWITEDDRFEEHEVTVDVWAVAASPPALGDPPPKSPAEAIATAVESALNWSDLITTSTTTLIGVERLDRGRKIEGRREHHGRRVPTATLRWKVEIEERAAP